jgi:hypothetical protein
MAKVDTMILLRMKFMTETTLMISVMVKAQSSKKMER